MSALLLHSARIYMWGNCSDVCLLTVTTHSRTSATCSSHAPRVWLNLVGCKAKHMFADQVAPPRVHGHRRRAPRHVRRHRPVARPQQVPLLPLALLPQPSCS